MEKNNCAKNVEESVQTFGTRLSEFIEKKGMTKNALAKEIKISPQSVSNYCSGKYQPKPSFVEVLVRRFGANREWLMTGKGPMFSSEIECVPKHEQRPAQTPDDQVVELKHRLAEQILAGVELRDRQSRWLSKALEAIAKTAKVHGMTQEQHLAVMEAVLDPEKAMAALEAAQSHQAAVGD